MLKKSTLEDIISKDLAAIWAILTPDERRLVADNFHIHNFKKNQIIYAEKDSPRYLWCLLKGKVKLSKDGMEEGSRFCAYIVLYSILDIGLFLPTNPTFQVLRLLRHLLWVQFQ